MVTYLEALAYYNPTYQVFATSNAYADIDWNGFTPIPQITLDGLVLSLSKIQKKDLVDQYLSTLLDNGFTYLTKSYDLTEQSRNRVNSILVEMIEGYAFPAGFTWDALDGTEVSMSQTTFRNFGLCLIDYFFALRAYAVTSKSNIDGFTTVEDVDNYDITTGWPSNNYSTVPGGLSLKTLVYYNTDGLIPGSITGNAVTATTLQTARNIAVSTDATGSVSFNGSQNVTIPLTLANSGVSAGTYRSVTVDAKGRVTAGTNPSTLTGYGITDAQPLDADLTAIAALTGTGFLKRTGPDTWSLDTSAYLTNITLTGDITGTGTSSIATTLATVATAGTYRSVTINAKGLVTSGTNPTTLAGYGITDAQPLDADLTSIAALTTTGIATRTAADTWTTRSIASANTKITVTNGDGVAGNPTLTIVEANFTGIPQSAVTNLTTDLANKQPLNANLSSIGALTLTGILARTAANTWQLRSLQSANNKITITNNDAVAGNPTFTINEANMVIPQASVTNLVTDLANKQPLDADLTSLAGQTGTGFATRTAADTWTTRTITSTNTKITVTNGDGVSGNPSLTINEANLVGIPQTGVTNLVTDLANKQPLDGELTAISALAANGHIVRTSATTVAVRTMTGTTNQIVITNGDGVSGNPTFAISSDPVIPGDGGIVIPVGATGDRTPSAPNGTIRYNSTIGRYECVESGNWQQMVTSSSPFQKSFTNGSVAVTSATTTFNATNAPTSAQGTQLWTTSITPVSNASKFVINFSPIVGVSTQGRGVALALFRGTTLLTTATAWFQATAGLSTNDADGPESVSLQFVDSPNTASAVTYSIRAGIIGGNGTWYLGRGSASGFALGGTNSSVWTISEL